MFSKFDYLIFDGFNFYREDKWIPAAFPIAIFAIICIVIHTKEAANAKLEEREIKPIITILYVIGAVVGIVELCAVLQGLMLLSVFVYGLFYIITIPLMIFVVVSTVRFILDSGNAKKEGRPRKTNVKVMFVMSMIICFYYLITIARWFLVFIR